MRPRGTSWILNTELHQVRKILTHSPGWGQDTSAFAPSRSSWASCLSLGHPRELGGPRWVGSQQFPRPHHQGQCTELPVMGCFVSIWHVINRDGTNYLCHSFWGRRRCMKSSVGTIHQGLRWGRGSVTVTGSGGKPESLRKAGGKVHSIIRIDAWAVECSPARGGGPFGAGFLGQHAPLLHMPGSGQAGPSLNL